MGTIEFVAAFCALYAAHQVGDHWVQTDRQAAMKGHPGWQGRAACALHVATYTLTGAAALAATALVVGADFSLPAVAAGLGVSAVTHYIADRREPLRRLAVATGHPRFVTLGLPRPGRDDNPSLGTGMYALDQAWHVGWMFVASLVIGGA